eukprot:PhF_6_TR27851/c3_g1_i2/m.40687
MGCGKSKERKPTPSSKSQSREQPANSGGRPFAPTYVGFNMEEWKKKQAEIIKKAQDEQSAIDTLPTPSERLVANRKRYQCGDRYVTAEKIPNWAQAISTTTTTTTTTAVAAPLGELLKSSSYSYNTILNERIAVFKGDITTLEIDAIVNAANSSLLGGGGVDGAIHSASGPLLREECQALGGCVTGNTKITNGYKLPAKHVLHTVGPTGAGDEALKQCYETSLKLVDDNKLKSIAFCCISTGVFGFPLERATIIALQTVRAWLETKLAAMPEPKNKEDLPYVIFCVFTNLEMATYEKYLNVIFPTSSACDTQQQPTPQQQTSSSMIEPPTTVKVENDN